MMGPSDSVEEPFRIGYIHVYITIRYSYNNTKNLSSLADSMVVSGVLAADLTDKWLID